jgi:maltose alpha-D-glucosyltransferase/alpha-amylase
MGDAARPLRERRAKASPMRDVAGMLRSLDHAGMKALDALAMDRTEDARSFAHAIAAWSRGARLSFLAGFGIAPDDPTLRLFRLWWALDDAANDAARPYVRTANLNAVLARLESEDA